MWTINRTFVRQHLTRVRAEFRQLRQINVLPRFISFPVRTKNLLRNRGGNEKKKKMWKGITDVVGRRR